MRTAPERSPDESRLRRGAASRARASSGQALREHRAKLIGGNAILLQRVAIADRHRAIRNRLTIDRDTERRSDFILPPVAPPDRPRLVVEHRIERPQIVSD